MAEVFDEYVYWELQKSGNIDIARDYLLKGIAEGSGFAFHNLAYAFQYGEGVQQDFEKAKDLYRQALSSGVALSAYCLGSLLYHEDRVDEALATFERGALLQEPRSQMMLGRILTSDLSHRSNVERGKKFLTQAAAGGSFRAKREILRIELNQSMSIVRRIIIVIKVIRLTYQATIFTIQNGKNALF